MSKEHLLQTALALPAFGDKVAAAYKQKSEQMVQTMNSRMLARPDIDELIGGQHDMMKDNHANHARFIASVLEAFDANVLVETVLWVFRAYRSHGFTTNYWAAQLNAWIEVVTENMSPENVAAVLPLYEWMQVNIPSFVAVSEEYNEGLRGKH